MIRLVPSIQNVVTLRAAPSCRTLVRLNKVCHRYFLSRMGFFRFTLRLVLGIVAAKEAECRTDSSTFIRRRKIQVNW